MINTFEYGEFFNSATSGTISYPLMFVQPEGSVAKKGEIGYKYRIAIMDLLQKGRANLVDAASDTHQILLDVLTELFKGGQQATGGDYAFELKLDNIVIEGSEDKYDDEVYQQICDVILWVEWDNNQCAIPT